MELWPVLAIQVIGTIDYGSLEVGENTGINTEEVVVRNVGNVPMTPEVEGTNMIGQSTIAVSRQKFSSSTFNYEIGGKALSTSSQGLGFVLSKQTSTSPIEGPSFWGISLPTGIGSGLYQGTNTFWAKPE